MKSYSILIAIAAVVYAFAGAFAMIALANSCSIAAVDVLPLSISLGLLGLAVSFNLVALHFKNQAITINLLEELCQKSRLDKGTANGESLELD